MKRQMIPKLLSCLLITVTLFTACKSEEPERDTPDPDSVEIRPEVVFDVVDDEPLQFFIESRGVVEPLQRIKITPRISGFVEEHNIVEGRLIEKGDVLLKLDDEEWVNQERSAYNEYQQAKNEFDIESRLRNESGNGSEDQQSLLRITTGLAEAELAWERAKLNVSYATLKAPFSGRISAKQVVSRGAYVSAGSELGSLIDAAIVHIRFDVLESEIDNLDEGMPVELSGPGGTPYEGEIIAISPEVNPDTKTGQVLVEVENNDYDLKTGMTVDGRVFVRSQKSKVRMPREALLERDGRTLVFRLNNEEVEWIYVEPVAMNSDWVLIDHPEIEPGDTLAVDQHFSISHQQKVVPLLVN
ncbi:MAG: efflux RND transporter periplasmic adaptor subunit [Gracilimonas sp.]|uniref:efflux RND transporter periplasmic adaptor subunit n=1 Tax=Gracilimonas sp. TaxID=1974203 RepID=UPI001986D488|nr:efflux RND transporter periplasmic adaptor subunit [Gracilimonas sp.]MBD3615532.1 efflux RND transporter periplasmic adaptor subunit [Gracilimonas sp.]